MKVLVVDDAPPIHWLVAAWLKKDGVSVEAASGGAEALKLAHRVKPDLILLDIDMPGMDGFETCRRFMDDPEFQRVPIVFLTASSEPDDMTRGLDLGASDYILKPFDRLEFCARIRAALRNKRLMDLLAETAQIDALTGLRNRGYLDTRLAAAGSRFRRDGETYSVLMCDVDHFKTFNDAHGHAVGDVVLVAVAKAVAEACREEDIVCRYGGEELCVLTPGVAGPGAASLGERLRAAVDRLTVAGADGQVLSVTVSVGVASSGDGPDVLGAADSALYDAKRAGRNRVVMHRRDEASDPRTDAVSDVVSDAAGGAAGGPAIASRAA